MKISMKDIRAWYEQTYGKLDETAIEYEDHFVKGYDICDILWYYEKSRKEMKTQN